VSETLLFIPTFNERENVERIYGLIKGLNLDLDLLFMDDNSPDGTGEILDRLAAADPRLRVIHRTGKLGIGSAHKEAIAWAAAKKYRVLVTMDCDLTHSPDLIPLFLRHGEEADVVLGSRFMSTESLADWNFFRKFLTHLGHFLTRYVLRVPYDATGAFRLYRLDRIRPELFALVESGSYAFFFESLYVLCHAGARIHEVPIALPKRTYGHSKMALKDVLGSVQRLLILFGRSFRYKARIRAITGNSSPASAHARN
jgi:dolichol-phosphate mannosyltransferase